MQIKKKALSLLLSVMLGVTMLVALPAQAYAVAPTISSATLQQGQNRVRVEFSEGIWGDAAQTTPVLDTDFVLSYSGSATVTLDHISKESNAALTGGESFILFYFTVSGTVSAGDTIEITTAPGASIFNGAGEAVTTTETTGVLTFLQPITWLTATANGSSGVTTTTTLTLTFSEDPGALTTGVVSITGATLDSISGSGTTRVLSISNITVADGAALNVYIPSTFGGGAITPTNRYPAVYVAAPVYVCEIVGGAQYTSLLSALTAANSGDTIKFLTDITEDLGVTVTGPDVLTIDLNNKDWDLVSNNIFVDGGTLTIKGNGTVTVDYVIESDGGRLTIEADIVSGAAGVGVYNGALVNITGNINLPSGGTGIYAENDGTVVRMTGSITVANGYNIEAYDGAEVYVTGSLISTGTSDSVAIYTGDNNSYVELDGNINTTYKAIYAYDYSEVYVKGNIDAGYDAVSAFDSDITVDGYIKLTADYSDCVVVIGESSVLIGGTVTANGNAMDGIIAGGVKATVIVVGNVDVTGFECRAVVVYGGGVAEVKGNITAVGKSARGVFTAEEGTAIIGGSIAANGKDAIGIDAFYKGIATVGGNVVATGEDAIGVQVQYSSEVTIEGKITAPIYISFGVITINGVSYDPYTKTAADNDSSSSKTGYKQYSESYQGGGIFPGTYTDYVWVKNLIISPIPNPDPDPTIPKTGDFDTLLASSLSLLFALMGAGALVVSRRKVRQS